jgi:hypothetical protein
MVTDNEIIIRCKELIKDQGKVTVLWLIREEFKLPNDMNHADNIACKLTAGMKYERYDGHNPNDIFIRQRADYIPKMIGLATLIIGLLISIYKVI